MKVTTFITQTMKAQKVTQTRLASLLGLKSQGVVSGRLRNGNITMENSIKMLDVLGYDIYAVPKGYNKDHPTFTAEPMKLTVYDEGDGLTPDEMVVKEYMSTLVPEMHEAFSTQPFEVQLQIAKAFLSVMKNSSTDAQ